MAPYKLSYYYYYLSVAELLCIFDFRNGGRPPSWIWCDVISDHPRCAHDGLSILLKLHVDRIYILQDIVIYILSQFGLKLPIQAPFGNFWGYTPNEFRYCRNSKRTVLGRKHVARAINHENPSTDSTWARAREKIQYNLVTRKKVTKP